MRLFNTKYFIVIRLSIVLPLTIYFTCLNGVVASAPPSEENDVHFCGFEEWQRDHRRFARTLAADANAAILNAGAPRTVRMIYFLPNDRPFNNDVVEQLKDSILKIQTFYGEQMKAHGYGYKTFKVETDLQGEPKVHRVVGQHSENYYLDDARNNLVPEIGQTFDLHANIYLVVFDNSSGAIGQIASRIGGSGRRTGKNSGVALVAAPFKDLSTHVAAHELGHAFGLYHDFNNRFYLMSYGARSQSRLSVCHAEFLAVHPHFNPDSPIEEGQPTAIELISSPSYPAGSESVSVQLKLGDSDGLHQVILLRNGYEVWGCRGLGGENNATVNFDYDGYSGDSADWNDVTGLRDFDVHRITVMAVDSDGGVSEKLFELSQTEWTHPRPTRLEKISGDNQQGAAYTPLDHPLVVEVRDQNDNPLPGAQLTFAVITGAGKLSGRFTVETTTSDANGRSAKTLTLGPGINIVAVTCTDIEKISNAYVDFQAIGVGQPTLPMMDGDYRTWHLPDDATLRLGKGRIGESERSVAFSPDGKLLAVASGIGVWLYDVATYRELALLPTPSRAHSVAFSRDGNRLASGVKPKIHDRHATAFVWDLATRTRIAELRGGPEIEVADSSVSFSPDGDTLAYWSYWNKTVTLWDVTTGHVATLGEKHGVGTGGTLLDQDPSIIVERVSVSFSPDGTLLASGSDDGTVTLWDVATQTRMAALNQHKHRVTSVSFSRDGRLLASGSIDETVKLWDVLKKVNIATFRGHSNQISSVSFSRDGRLLASAGNGRGATIKIWDVKTKQDVITFGTDIGANAVSFSHDGTLLASGSEDGTVKLWDVESGNVEFAISGHASVGKSVSFSPDGNTLASGSRDGMVRLWDVATGRNVETFGRHNAEVNAVSFSPDGTLLASGSNDTTVKLWEAATGTTVDSKFSYGCGGQVNSVSFSRDGTIIASGDARGVLLWNTVTGDRIATPLGYAASVKSVSFSPNGALLAFGSDFGVKLWDVETHAPIDTLAPENQVNLVAFSPDGTILASTGGWSNGIITLWNVRTGENIGTLDEGLSSVVTSLSFWRNGSILAAFTGKDRIILWHVSARAPLGILDGHTGPTEFVGGDPSPSTSVSFSRDAPMLASGSDDDGTILLWDLSTSIERLAKVSVEVYFPDPNLRARIAETLGKPDSAQLTGGEMLALTHLEAGYANISDLTGLDFATNLTGLWLWGNAVSDISAVSGLINLTILGLASNAVSDISAVSGLTNLISLNLENNAVSDISAVSGLINLKFLYLGSNKLSDISAVANLTKLVYLNFQGNSVSDLSPLVANMGLNDGDQVIVVENPLNYPSINTHIPTLQERGVDISYDDRTPQRIRIVSASDQQGLPNEALASPFVVEIQDQNDVAFEGVPVTFAVAAGGGTLSVTNTTTDSNGRAESTLTLGPNLGRNTVEVSAAGIEGRVIFNAISNTIADNTSTEFLLSIPAGTSLIHVPLKVTAVDGAAKSIESISDLYDALGGANAVSVILNEDGNWISYLGGESAGSISDAAIGDDTALIVVMKKAATLELVGDALGSGGESRIDIGLGNNLVGVPLDPADDMMISDLLLVEGVTAITVSNDAGDGFNTISRNNLAADVPIEGGVGYLVVATAEASIPVTGSAWANEGGATAPAVAFSGTQTPVLHVEGDVMDEFNMLARIPELSVTVKNLSTGASLDTVIGTETSPKAYSGTFVELERRAAKAGDVLEITAHSPNPYVGVQPVPQVVVSAETVLTSRIELSNLELYEIPTETELLANFPNPFNPETWIPYRLAKAAKVTLEIYDTHGRTVRSIDVGVKPAAVYESRASAIYWDGRNNNGERVASGTYFYHLTAGDGYASTRRMLILK